MNTDYIHTPNAERTPNSRYHPKHNDNGGWRHFGGSNKIITRSLSLSRLLCTPYILKYTDVHFQHINYTLIDIGGSTFRHASLCSNDMLYHFGMPILGSVYICAYDINHHTQSSIVHTTDATMMHIYIYMLTDSALMWYLLLYLGRMLQIDIISGVGIYYTVCCIRPIRTRY